MAKVSFALLAAFSLGTSAIAQTQFGRADPEPPPAPQANHERALRNYFDILNGRKQLHQLTPIEQEEVRQVEAQRLLEPRRLNNKSECRERERSADSPSQLEESLLDLKCSQLRD